MTQFRIYGFEGCPFCQRAKMILTKEGVPFEYVEVGEEREQRSAWLDARGITGDQRTFPRVYIFNGQKEILVGGYQELEDHLVFA